MWIAGICYIEKNAGIISGIQDDEYTAAGAIILDSAADIWDAGEMILKVKEPLKQEFGFMKEGQILFTFLHLAANKTLTDIILEKKIIGIAYETVQCNDGSLPLVVAMSAVAGRLAIQMGCACLEVKNGGRGILLSGVPGVAPANVTIVGGGISGLNAAHLASGMGAVVTVIDVNFARLCYIEDIFHCRVVTLMSNSGIIEESCINADLVIGSVLIPGARATKPIKRDIVRKMKKGSLLWTSPLIRADALKPAGPRRTLIRFTSKRASSTTRCQYAGSFSENIDVRINERNASLHGGYRQQGLSKSNSGRSRTCQRRKCPQGKPHVPPGRRSFQHGVC